MIAIEKYIIKLAKDYNNIKYGQVILGDLSHPKILKQKIEKPFYLKGATETTDLFEVACLVKGRCVISLDGRAYLLDPGDIAFVKHDVKHFESHYKENIPYELIWIMYTKVDRVVMTYNINKPVGNHRHVQSIKMEVDEETMFLLEDLYHIADHKKRFDFVKDRICRWFEILKANIEAGNFEKRTENAAIRRELNMKRDRISKGVFFLKQNFRKDISLKEIADKSGLNPSYFGTLFKEVYNVEPLTYLILLKLREACYLLRTSDLTIKEISFRMGYTDQYFFSRIFKKYLGISPKGYRKRSFLHFDILSP